MSYLKVKKAILTKLLTVVSASDLALENKKFDPSNKELWYAAYFLPTSSETMGKTSASSDEQRGIFQVSVFVNINRFDYDDSQLTAIDAILSAFTYNTNLVYNGQKIDILNSEVNSGSESEAWYQRDISINYLTFSERV
tara:strand:- start:2751 stop:3167 length:417 start_codon:yes stop_codon:yes gene_type:complete